MPAIGQDDEMWCGDTRVLLFPVLDKAGQAVDLSGASARWWVGTDPYATGDAVLIHKSTASGQGVTITGPATVGTVTGVYSVVVSLLPADTASKTPGLYYHEVEVVDAAGQVATVALGKFRLRRDLVR